MSEQEFKNGLDALNWLGQVYIPAWLEYTSMYKDHARILQSLSPIKNELDNPLTQAYEVCNIIRNASCEFEEKHNHHYPAISASSAILVASRNLLVNDRVASVLATSVISPCVAYHAVSFVHSHAVAEDMIKTTKERLEQTG